MRKSIGAATAAVMALLAGGTTSATAADMSMAPIYQTEPAQLVEFGSGWYLRGDVGYVNYGLPGPGGVPVVNGQHTANSVGSVYNNTITREGVLGTTLGVGYQFNSFFRMDATYDWRQNVTRNTRTVRACGIDEMQFGVLIYNPTGGDCYTQDKVQTMSWTGLLNGYADLGTWYGLTPYIGGGIGMTHIHASATEDWFWASGQPYGIGGNIYQSNSVNAPGFYHFGYPANQGPVQNRDNFAWALMAGLAYDVAPHVKIDVGYRYLNMGVVSAINVWGQTTHPVIDSQEVRVGLRITPDL